MDGSVGHGLDTDGGADSPTDSPVAPAAPTGGRRRVIGFVMLGAGVAVLAAMGWVGWRAYQAYTHLQAAAAEVSTLQDQLQDITALDGDATARTVASLQQEAAAARSATQDPVYRLAGSVPLIGANLRAIGEVATVVDGLSTTVMPSLVQIATTLDPAALSPRDGAIDLAPLQTVAPLLQAADAEVVASRTRLAAIDRSDLVGQVDSAVVTLAGKLDDAAAVTATGARAARLLPPMLGADGPRTYLVVFQNLAEPRATGGIFGSFALVRADGGRIDILDQGAPSRVLKEFRPPLVELPENEKQLYTTGMAIYPQDVNFTPDFPTAASIFATMYTTRTGTAVDGVLAVDPVALSYLMKGIPAIDVGQGVAITSENVAEVLLKQAYDLFPEEDQSARDDFLAGATGRAFDAVTSGAGSARTVLDGLRRAVQERRLMVWSATADEQDDLAATSLSGSLPTDPAHPSIGVFLNDGTGAKLGYYLHNSVSVTPGECGTDGRRALDVAVTLDYRAPSSGLPPYVLGLELGGAPYALRTNLLVFAPVGGGIVMASQEGAPTTMRRGEDEGREVGTTTLTMMPGESRTVTVRVLGPAPSLTGTDELSTQLVVTPGVRPWELTPTSFPVCPAPTS
ncbi:hypothetical protein GCM10009818_35130 [Nakamurella flavida]